MTSWKIEIAHSRHLEGILSLFKSAGSPCFCQYWSFQGDHRQWQMRCAAEPEQNAQALSREFGEESVEAVVALEGSRVVGWCRLRLNSKMSKLLEGRLYRGLACLGEKRDRAWVLSCFLVDPAWRRRSVGRALLRGAVERARELGASRVEAFPCGANDVSDEQQWMGPLPMYLEQGFAVVHDFGPYPVLRLEIAGDVGLTDEVF